jgi:hypothetical protein
MVREDNSLFDGLTGIVQKIIPARDNGIYHQMSVKLLTGVKNRLIFDIRAKR